jgi:hypothetical protein
MERIPLAEAAQRLGLTVDATRKRIKRGILAADKDADGRWYVTLQQEGDPGEVDPRIAALSTPATRPDEDLRTEVAFLRERLREAERERAELRRMLHLEQQTLARFFPEHVSVPLLAPRAAQAAERAGEEESRPERAERVDAGERSERGGFWRRVARVLFYE